MSSILKPLSDYDFNSVPSPEGIRFAILVSEWNFDITGSLMQACVDTLITHGVREDMIIIQTVPGSFELSTAAQWMADDKHIGAIICLGCVIQGETRHFDFICDAVAHGLTEVGLRSGKPVIFGVLTTQNQQQALDRAGGKLGNKGVEAAVTAIKMAVLKEQIGEKRRF